MSTTNISNISDVQNSKSIVKIEGEKKKLKSVKSVNYD
jgi:hypothetical protein